MIYKALWDSGALEDLKETASKEAVQIVEKVDNYLVKNPRTLGNVLTAEYKGLYRYRFGDYRIIYEILPEEQTIIIIKIGHRSKVYKR